MRATKLALPPITACVFALLASVAVATPFDFDRIEYWVGTGTNRAALVIDWVEDSSDPPALAWGYRWDGTATGRDMLLAVVAADARLFAKLGDTPANPIRVFGLGYDGDDDGLFALDDDTAFDADGIAYTGPADLAMSLDADDAYAEGWFTGFWHYGIAASNPYDGGNWSDTSLGMVGRVLADGAWDSWTFEASTMPPFNAFAENPAAAPPPYRPGDFNHDTRVDDADYQLWKSKFGSTSSPEIDASGNGLVDAADYTIWRDHFGTGGASPLESPFTAPEPPTIVLALGLLLFLFPRRYLDERIES